MTTPNQPPDDNRLRPDDPWIMHLLTDKPLPPAEKLARTVMATASNVRWIFALTLLNVALTLYCAIAVHQAEDFIHSLSNLVP